ncbi:SPFH domain-containing protein [Sebaldella sp. S0638]|uniref:SPFH domain-containing protein n=1 Tax=Sebaldella sp. S0638 TaxID=2957809 RepID=UPI0020A1D2D5|nr:SPFH domain-containing protein [Sebaldella sp. S0638]MCP1226730.1 SPFH domain-containing protein [Sebaldella sp. S0638]
MKKIMMMTTMLGAILSCGPQSIETGNVGIVKLFGQVKEEIKEPGLRFTWWADIYEVSLKETEISLNDLKPKAKDNLFLDDLDVSVYYNTSKDQAPKLFTKYSNQYKKIEKKGETDKYFVGYTLVEQVARSVIFDKISEHDSLTIHQQRNVIEVAIKNQLQEELDKNDQGAFKITRVIIKGVATDKSVEEAFRRRVTAEKDLETANLQQEKAKIEAETNNIKSTGLTDKVLQEKYLETLKYISQKGNNTFIVDLDNQKLLNIK